MVQLIVWVVVGLLALSFFGVSLRGLYESQTNQENLSFLTEMLRMGWESLRQFLEPIGDFLNNIFGNRP